MLGLELGLGFRVRLRNRLAKSHSIGGSIQNRLDGSVATACELATEPSRRFRYFAATEPSIVLTVPQFRDYGTVLTVP